MNDHVTNLELSNELQELGIKTKYHYVWMWGDVGSGLISATHENSIIGEGLSYTPAYLATELLEILPKDIEIPQHSLPVERIIGNSSTNPDLYVISYVVFFENHSPEKIYLRTDISLPNALAKMLIYLKKNKLI